MAVVIVPDNGSGYPHTSDASYPSINAATQKVVVRGEALTARGDASDGFFVEAIDQTAEDLDRAQVEQAATGSDAAAAIARWVLRLINA